MRVEEATEILSDTRAYVIIRSGYCILDGEFTPEQLEATLTLLKANMLFEG